MRTVVVTGGFDNLASHHVRILEEASKLGEVQLLLWSDEAMRQLEGSSPIFPGEERLYLLQAIRYVKHVTLVNAQVECDLLRLVDQIHPDVWVVGEESDTPQKRWHCNAKGVEYHVFKDEHLKGFPVASFRLDEIRSFRKKVIVTGCFDWFHSGHVRFFEEVSELGDLYVVVGHDANVRLLKGPGHPLLSQDERLYMVQAVRHVKHARISSGHGWMDAEREIAILKPDIYAVNEDGDKAEKRAFCEARGIQYISLKRRPKPGLPARQSRDLRGF